MSATQFRMVGASNHTDKERETNDYYATPPEAIDYLLSGGAELSHNLWECACGGGHLSRRLADLGYNVTSTDLIYRGFGVGGVDFLQCSSVFDGDIITNPPFKYSSEFCSKALELVQPGRKVFMFLKLQFLEGKARRALFDTKQLKAVYVLSGRVSCAKNGLFGEYKAGSALCYAWFEFQKGFNGDPVIKWIN